MWEALRRAGVYYKEQTIDNDDTVKNNVNLKLSKINHIIICVRRHMFHNHVKNVKIPVYNIIPTLYLCLVHKIFHNYGGKLSREN